MRHCLDFAAVCLGMICMLFFCGCGRTTPDEKSIPRPLPDTPLTRIATGTGVPDIVGTVEGKAVQKIASEPAAPDVEPLVLALYTNGWPCTAARLAKQQAGKQSWIFRRVALESGDGELFWASKNASETAAEYWRREVPAWYGGERRYRLIKAWPSGDASPERLMSWVYLPLVRPVPETGASLLLSLYNVVPRPVNNIILIIEPMLDVLTARHLILALILPAPGLPPEKLAMNIATLQQIGINWEATRLLTREMTPRFLASCAPWALEHGDGELLFRVYENQDFTPGLNIGDWVSSLPPEEFSRLAMGLRRPVLARHHAIKEMSDLIGSASAKLPPGFSEFFEPELRTLPEKIATSAYWLFTELAPGFRGKGAGLPGVAPIIRSRDSAGISGNPDNPDSYENIPASISAAGVATAPRQGLK